MRVQQSKIDLDFLRRSQNWPESIFAWMVGMGFTETLIDDSGLGTRVVPLAVNTLSDCAIAFMAKDSNTMLGGLRAAGTGREFDNDFNLSGANGQQLSVLVYSWNAGSIRYKSKAAAALVTIGHNIKTRALKNDHLQSVSANVASVSRDGLMLQRGTIVFVYPASATAMTGQARDSMFTVHATYNRCTRSVDPKRLANLVAACYNFRG